MDKKLKVIVLTQQDAFFIPTNIIKASEVCEIIEVVNNNAKSSLDNKVTDMIKWFGFFQCAHMGVKQYYRKLQNQIDLLLGLKVHGGVCSVEAAAKRIGARYSTVSNVNDENYIGYVKRLEPDLIISYSAPQVIKPQLLRIPKYGILNVHGALLPNYRGCLPSFWYLFNDEKEGGATVHYMSEDIDDGDICVQKAIDISECKTMFQLMTKTKLVGGEAMVEAIKLIADGSLKTKKNDVANGTYYSWPTIEQARLFRKKGYRLI